MIDSLRDQIHHRLEQLAEEANRLRHALAVLDPRSTPTSTSTASPPARKRAAAKSSSRAAAAATGAARSGARATAAKPKEAATKSAPSRRARKPAAPSPAPRASAPGATRTAVLSALGDEPLTAGQVAEKTGLARGTVSTTLSRLAKTGEVHKAERGYALAPGAEPPPPARGSA